jgi:glycine hydroxymethyltransferase
MQDFLFEGRLSELDPDIGSLIELETQRQLTKLIMIPSESLCPKAVLEALASPFTNKYAEGYPSVRMSKYERDMVFEFERYLAFHRRYGDRRFYKGAEYTNFVEVIAQKRAAEIFAANGVPPERIFVNVQPLSGAAANNAVYEAFVQPGETIMGMSLSYGGHLTHGSPFNRSGKYYKVYPYVVNMQTGKLDYDEIHKQAERFMPKMIIAGASAYPWEIDWARLRRIADSVPVYQRDGTKGAILLADIAHTAGLIVAGLFPSPIGYAHVITLTTHKTLCGPRSAIILTTEERKARLIDAAVFPCEQGGPHINSIAAKAVCFKIAQTDRFKHLQRRIVENCIHLGDTLRALGLKLVYGGTNTHLLLIDLNAIQTRSGIPLKGDVASNILDLCGITCNKNAIPGDETGSRPGGIRLGTVILSQLGMGKPEMHKIARLIHRVLTSIDTFKVVSPVGRIVRGKIDPRVIEETNREVKELIEGFVPGRLKSERREDQSHLLEIRGERALNFLQEVTSVNLVHLEIGQSCQAKIFDTEGKLIDRVNIARLNPDRFGLDRYLVHTSPTNAQLVRKWFCALSDGFVHLDKDIFSKISGPVEVKVWEQNHSNERELIERLSSFKLGPESDLIDLSKPYFIGQEALLANHPERFDSTKQEFTYKGYEGEPRRTHLYDQHLKLTKKSLMVPFAGWRMPLWYTRASEEHRAVRQTAALFDVSHMGRLEIKGRYAQRFLDLVTTNYVARLRIGQAHYSYILDPDGNVMDDVFIYRFGSDRYVMVTNAVNAEKIRAWLEAVNSKRVIIDRKNRGCEIEDKVDITDLRDPEAGTHQLVNLALQGPNSLIILQRLAKNKGAQERLATLQKSTSAEIVFSGINTIVTRTGYTGEEIGFEIFVEYRQAARLWELILESGKELGIKPAGLAARDSARIEAGLPLYGHELAGPYNIIPMEAVYGAFVKRHKPFFIGRDAMLEREKNARMRIVRFRVVLPGRAIRHADPVVDTRGECIGNVTSCTLVEGTQIGMAYVNKAYAKEGTKIGIFALSRDGRTSDKSIQELKLGDRTLLHVEAVVLSRFMERRITPLNAIQTASA